MAESMWTPEPSDTHMCVLNISFQNDGHQLVYTDASVPATCQLLVVLPVVESNM